MNKEAQRWLFDAAAWTVGIALAVALITDAVAGERKVPSATNAAWQAECASCHVAYPPRLLPAQSWRAIMKGLDRHFGVDASVDSGAAADIGAFLEANARLEGSKWSDPTALRITESGWFRHEHGDIAASMWKRADVRSAANCGACHRGADSGDFSERNLRLPR